VLLILTIEDFSPWFSFPSFPISIASLYDIEPKIVCVAKMWRYVDDRRHCSVLDTTL
jgi:hypothetical protein